MTGPERPRTRWRPAARSMGLTMGLLAALLLSSGPARADPALLFDFATGFVPYANDVPLMAGAGVRLAEVHELWARFGYMPAGDDRSYAFGVGGYRAVLRPRETWRPVLGGLFAGLPATCTHDAQGNPACAAPPLFIFAALGGIRFEADPRVGFSLLLELGTDSHPNPFGMVEAGMTVALPL